MKNIVSKASFVLLFSLVVLMGSNQVHADFPDMGKEVQLTPEEIEKIQVEFEEMEIPSYEEMEQLLTNDELNSVQKTQSMRYIAKPWSEVPYNQLKMVINEQCAAGTQAKYVLGDSFSTSSGSDIIMASGKGWKNYGYCHIYQGHMKNNILGKLNYNYLGKSQFQLVHNPYAMIDIMKNVINKDLYYDKVSEYRILKEEYNVREQQRVRVVLDNPKGWTTREFDQYDWIVVSSYPVF